MNGHLSGRPRHAEGVLATIVSGSAQNGGSDASWSGAYQVQFGGAETECGTYPVAHDLVGMGTARLVLIGPDQPECLVAVHLSEQIVDSCDLAAGRSRQGDG